MTELIAVAIITGACSVAGQVFISNAQANKHQAVTDVRLDILEGKLDKHNKFVERVAILETSQKTIAEDIKEIKENCKLHS